MIAPPAAPRRALKETFKESLARFVAAAPYVRHMRPAAALPEERRLLDERAALVALAIDRLSGASVRAAASGKPVSVSVPDAATAAVFEAALALTSKRRVTDRLLTIVVEAADRYAS